MTHPVNCTDGSASVRARCWTLLVAIAAALICSISTAQVPADPYSYSRVVSYTYDAAGRLLSETAEPEHIGLCLWVTHAYDTWGNRNASTTSNCAGAVPIAQQFASRSSSANYSSTAGLFPTAAINALGQGEAKLFDARHGIVTQLTGPNGLATNWTLDAFGRVTRESRADGTSTITRYCFIAGRVTDTSSNSAGCEQAPAEAPADAVSYMHTEPRSTGDAQMGAWIRVYTDRHGRELRTATQSFDGANQPSAVAGQLIVRDVFYNSVGTKTIETQPYFLTARTSTTSGANDFGATRTEIDALGRPTTVYTADPRGLAGSQSYGVLGAKVSAKTHYAYAALTTTITNDRGQVRREEKNAAGLVVRITDPAGGQVVHQHDAFGLLVATKDALQNLTTVKYDIRGRKVELKDPDAGLIKYDYNPLGEVVWQQTPNQRAASPVQATTMVYDKLGRMISRTEPEGTGTWSYDKYADNSACAKGNGKLCESRYQRAGTSDVRATKHYFDALGREVSSVASVTNGPTMASSRSYDAVTGRLATKTFPTGVQVGYAYTNLGYAQSLKLLTQANLSPLPATAGGAPGASLTLAANTILWRAVAVNAWGKVEQHSTSNGITSRLSLEAATGRIVALTAGPGTSNTTIDHAYTWDSLNNLTYRVDNIGDAIAGAVTETFEYGDSLSRLTKYTVSAPAVAGGSREVTMAYNALGMMLSKSDVGVYTYGASGASSVRPHALLSLAPTGGGAATTYTYDANGNLTAASAGKYRTIAYTSFNLPDSQGGIGGETSNGASSRYTWLYDENRQRIKEVRTITGGGMAGARTTWYLHPDNAGGLDFESEVNSPTTPSAQNPAQTSNRHYLSFGSRTIAVLVTTGNLPTIATNQTAPIALSTTAAVKLEYWYKDHLGSLIATSDHAGATTARYAYDPFGKRRFTNGSYDAFGTITVDWTAAANKGTDRGYTEHEHLDDVGIIHMNGRLFDPTTARFLQTDPFVQDPANLQNYNRYAYCYNNPLTCTDPTGMFLAALWDSFVGWISGGGSSSAPSNYSYEASQYSPGSGSGSGSGSGGALATRPTVDIISQGAVPDGCGAGCVGDGGAITNGSVQRERPSNDVFGVQTGIQIQIDRLVESQNYSTLAMVGGSAATAVNQVFVPADYVDVALLAVGPIAKVGGTATRITGEALVAARREFEAVVKPAFWRNEALSNPGAWSADNLERMRRGKAPIGDDGYPIELHHNTPLAEGGSNTFDNLTPLTRTDHRLGDNYRLNHPNLP